LGVAEGSAFDAAYEISGSLRTAAQTANVIIASANVIKLFFINILFSSARLTAVSNIFSMRHLVKWRYRQIV